MTRQTPLYIILLLAALAPGLAHPDTLVLDKGDTLSGEIIELGEGTLVFRTALAGQIIVPLDQVRTLRTDNPLRITLNNGQIHTGKLNHHNGVTEILTKDTAKKTTLSLADIRDVHPAQTASNDTHGTIETGIVWREGNDSYSDLFVKLRLKRNTALYAIQWTSYLELTHDGSFPQTFATEFGLSRDRENGWSPGARIALRRDLDAALSLRAEIGIGLSKELFATQLQSLQGGADLNLVLERYSARYRARRLAFQDTDLRHNELALDLHLQYQNSHYRRFVLEKGLRVSSSLTELGQLRARYDSALRFPIGNGLNLKLHLAIDFDNEPQYRWMDEWSTSVAAGLTWDF